MNLVHVVLVIKCLQLTMMMHVDIILNHILVKLVSNDIIYYFKSIITILICFSAQRWMAPGETKGGADIYNFYSCCKGKLEDPGCCSRRHLTFDDPEDVTQLRYDYDYHYLYHSFNYHDHYHITRPGMHKKFEAEKKTEECLKETEKSLNRLTFDEKK